MTVCTTGRTLIAGSQCANKRAAGWGQRANGGHNPLATSAARNKSGSCIVGRLPESLVDGFRDPNLVLNLALLDGGCSCPQYLLSRCNLHLRKRYMSRQGTSS